MEIWHEDNCLSMNLKKFPQEPSIIIIKHTLKKSNVLFKPYDLCITHRHLHALTHTHIYWPQNRRTMSINLSAVTIVDDRKNGFTDVDNNVFVWPVSFTDPVVLRCSAAVSFWTKLFRDYVKLGSFSDNKTETSIKSSRFKSHKRRVAREKERKNEKKKVYDDRGMGFYLRGQLNVFTRLSQVFYCSMAVIKRLCIQ